MNGKTTTSLEKVMGALVVIVMGFSILLVAAAQLAGRASCGEWLAGSSIISGLRFIVSGNAGDFGSSAAGCVPSAFSIWGTLGAFIAIVLILAGIIWWKWRSYLQSTKWLMKDIARREGVAQAKEVREIAGVKALMAKAESIRPGLHKPKYTDCGMVLGTCQGQKVAVSSEDSIILVGPPRSGKGFYLIINAILDSPGAVITTSTRADNYAATASVRAANGSTVTLFDPQGLSGLPSTLKWSPLQGCEKAMVAMRRAKVLVASSGMGQSSSNQEWAQVAETLLAYLLHAGALGKKSAHDLGTWGSSPEMAKEAVRILEEHPDASMGWGMNLRSELETDPRMLPSKWMGVTGALQALLLPEVAETLSPRSEREMLVPEDFIKNKGTLYLIGTKSGGGAIAPFLIALLDEIVETARQIAFRSPGGRLDPPMSLILDEIANLAVWPSLPQIMSDGGGVGISTVVVLQSVAQARGGWGEQEAQAIFDAAIIKIQLGGAGNTTDLKQFADLMGTREVIERNRSWSEGNRTVSESRKEKEVITVAELRRLPTGTALFMGRNGRPMLMSMVRWIDRPDAAQIKAGIAAFSEELLAELTSMTDEPIPLAVLVD
ncbi:hypothetical protein MB46_19580 (plasmid) [Arthrobacter alpinus]|uniref:type IV secretory system conjugative DNA transfer family protein n=1 Tax=Arthrobacter alpinus TaxID=656366 RepID=UPI0005C86778|nr:TraM recognition domain-containing protein [Arthrobacter alpinus]ALV47874.1 hypothetical protein MB46_19580 [Arthrobacter alpinus]